MAGGENDPVHITRGSAVRLGEIRRDYDSVGPLSPRPGGRDVAGRRIAELELRLVEVGENIGVATSALNGPTTGHGHLLFSAAGSVEGATNASPIVVTSTAHGLSNGHVVEVAGALGNTAANGTHTVAGKTADTFQLSGSTGNGVYAGGGVWRAPAVWVASDTDEITITNREPASSMETGDLVWVLRFKGEWVFFRKLCE